jgi:OFA family oxalate/formate antiporter-like MFS transporter
MKSNSEYISISFSFSRGWLVTYASAGLGLVLGILYVWSVVKSGVPDAWGWTNADKALPYSLMCVAFSITMVPAGQLQDRFGPRVVTLLGGFLAGLGLVICGLGGDSITVYAIGFGCVTGAGVGFGYSATTPASIKWFPPEKTGLVTGIVVAGFGISPVLLAPITSWFLKLFESTDAAGGVVSGISKTMIALGFFTWVVVGLLAQFVRNPPDGFSTLGGSPKTPRKNGPEFASRNMLSTAQFWLLYIMYFCGAAAGLTFISVAKDLGMNSLGELAFLAVVTIAAGNTLGRIFAGILSDKIGRQWTLFSAFICQGLMVATLFGLTHHGGGTWMLVLPVVFLLGMNYGANLALFPAACKDYFGIRNFGLNYGWMFTAFGSAGLVMPWVNGRIKDVTGSFDLAYVIIIAMMVVSAILAVISQKLGQPKQPPGPA